ncbi:hypothetical protein F5Y12DRAFT_790201 [Xylaria sp. FL1777]|nr:hypothetical protein F5Y12DRAFT_790201 [Xylaria sp. FL1777]
MKRQQSFQGGVPKRPCLGQQFAIQPQGNQPHAGQWSSNNTHLQSYAPEQLTPQPYYYNNSYSYNYNNYNNNNNNITGLPSNNTLNGYGSQMDFNRVQSPLTQLAPQKLAPQQLALQQLVPQQLAPAQLAPAQLAPPPSLPPHFTGFNTSSDMTFKGDSINGNVFPSHTVGLSNYPLHINNTTQGQKNASVSYPVSKPLDQIDTYQRFGEPQPSQHVTKTTRMHFPINTTGPQIEWNIPSQAPFQLPESYGTRPCAPSLARKRSNVKSVDTFGLDMVKIGQARSRKSSKSSVVEIKNPSTPSPATEKPSNPIPEIQMLSDPISSRNGEQPPLIFLDTELNSLSPDDSLEIGFDTIKAYLALEEQSEAEEARQKKVREEEEEAKRLALAQAAEWVGSPSEYPAECYENLRLPGCEFRAHSICVGLPGREWFMKQGGGKIKGPLVVYAVGRQDSDGVEFKLVKSGCSVEEVMRGPEIQFSDVQLNANFSDMTESQVTRWSRYLLAAVPGVHDTMTKWTV